MRLQTGKQGDWR